LALPKLLSLEKEKKKLIFLLLFARLFVSLALPKLLSLEKEKKKLIFLLLFARLFVSLHKNLRLL
jgi:hypothetical protein